VRWERQGQVLNTSNVPGFSLPDGLPLCYPLHSTNLCLTATPTAAARLEAYSLDRMLLT
jgi:hypothetical protein